ncbi:MAG: ribosome maturation factor RimP [Gammaproteobacteria bacterium]|nr:ribosome maturation factor RimP [Gammaproteobacteria bacterium]
MDKRLTSKICELVTPVAAELGCELWGCELVGLDKHKILRIYIDSEAGVTLDDCARVSHQVSGVLDVEDLITGNYDLEVSSPGIDRLLFKEEHYQKFIGSYVRIKLLASQDDERRNYKGQITAVANNEVILLVDDATVVLPITNIEKAKLVLDC